MKDKIIIIYNLVIIINIIVIGLCAWQFAFNIVNIAKVYPISIGYFSSIGLISFLFDKADYRKSNK
jgi:hypothetical protein